MGTYREQDPLASLMNREQARVLACLDTFATGGKSAALTEARRILRALGDAESEVLYPAFSRVRLRPEAQHLLDDSRGNRAEQLAVLDTVGQRRAPRLRKLATVQLASLINDHATRSLSVLIPILASQLARPLYRCIVQAFANHYDGVLAAAPPTVERPRRARAVASNA